MSNINIINEISERAKEIPSLEHVYGKGLMQPFVPTNSGSRRIMFGTQTEHMLTPLYGEPSLLQTGYENEYGRFSSSFVETDEPYTVIAKIPKFSFNENLHYFLIVQGQETGKFSLIEKISYRHITESYGYLYNTDYIDKIKVGSIIPKNKVIHRSSAFDENGNRQDGLNLITTYLACEHTKEDGIIISKSAARKLAVPLIRKIEIVINDNDIPLNIYGNTDNYKSFPDIGEEVKNGILCSLRREKKEEMLFSQSFDRLSKPMISDDKYTIEGRVIDIDINCNNPEILEGSHYYNQLRFYNNEKIKFMVKVVEVVKPIIESGAICDYELQKLYYNSLKILEGGQYIKERPFSNTTLEIYVLDESVVNIGDKISNRYGGKGVVSRILPDELMPQLENGDYVEIIFNSSTCINRENVGQLFETSLNHISSKLSDYFKSRLLHSEEILEMITKYLGIIVPEQARFLSNYSKGLNSDELDILIDSLINDKGLIISMKPGSESMDIDKLARIYNEFPFISEYKVQVPILNSMGEIRYVPTRRKLVCGKQYIYRLKQYAEEKFSAVSLSATNIRNENCRNTTKKAYKAIHSKTCIRFGEMETGDLIHLDPEIVVINLLIHSLSPKGRRMAEDLLTGDPFDVDVRLNEDASNRAVEILNAYLLTMGLEFEFEKVPKVIEPLFAKIDGLTDLFTKSHPEEVYDPTYISRVLEHLDNRRREGLEPLFEQNLFVKSRRGEYNPCQF